MGMVRFLLALAVILAHTAPLHGLTLVGGTAAVQTFYIISGFYMALILNEKYVGGRSSYGLFIGSRLLRLFPTYLVVLVATVAAQSLWPAGFRPSEDAGGLWYWRHAVPGISLGAALTLLATNVAILGQDVTMFLAYHAGTGGLYWTTNFHHEAMPAYHFLFVPQAWTLGLELTFYSVAPFLVRRGVPTLIGWIAASLALRAVLIARFGLRHDPWNYRFFPTELSLFLLGAVGYRVYRHLRETVKPTSPACKIALGVALGSILIYQYVPLHGKNLLFYPIMAATFPWLFLMTKQSRVDRFIGDLSYPIYISHLLVVELLAGAGHGGAALATIATTVVAIGLLRWVDRPIDRCRQGWVERAQSEPALR